MIAVDSETVYYGEIYGLDVLDGIQCYKRESRNSRIRDMIAE